MDPNVIALPKSLESSVTELPILMSWHLATRGLD